MACADFAAMQGPVLAMLEIAKDAFHNRNTAELGRLVTLEEEVDRLKKSLIAGHFARLAEGQCSIANSPYYSSAISGLERVADHLVNVGYSTVSPIGSEKGK